MSQVVGSQPHALYVAWAFPPSHAGGTLRTVATVNALIETGFAVTVLAPESDSFARFTGADNTGLGRIDSRAEVQRVPFAWPLRDHDISRWPRERALRQGPWMVDYLAHETDGFPETGFGPWLPALLGAADEVHARKPVDLTIGSAGPQVVLAVGHHLFTTADVPYVIDQRDAWRLDLYDGTESTDPRVIELEAAWIAAAHEVWFVNDPILRWHQQAYPASADRMRLVADGHDGDLATSARASGRVDGLTFTFVGHLTPHLPLIEFAEGWATARETSSALLDARANIWGYLDKDDRRNPPILDACAELGIDYRGPASQAETAALHAESDVLLLLLAGSPYLSSAKVYEYLATGLPIVSVHDPGSAATEILTGYPLWFPAADLSADAVARALLDAAGAARSTSAEVRAACIAFAARHQRAVKLGPAVAALLESVRG